MHESISICLQDTTQRDLFEYFGDVCDSVETADLPDVGQESSVSKHSADKVVSKPNTDFIDDFIDDADFQDHRSKLKSCTSSSESGSLMSKSGKSKKRSFPKTSLDVKDSSKTASKTSKCTLDTFVLKKETTDSACGDVSEKEDTGSSAGAARLASYLLSSVQDSPHLISSGREDSSIVTGSTGSCEAVDEGDTTAGKRS